MSLRNYFTGLGNTILTFFFVNTAAGFSLVRCGRRLLSPRKLPRMVLNSAERAA